MVSKKAHMLDVGLIWLQSNSVDKMRVETISRIAEVSKTTFYKHFTDKYDFIEEILQTQLNIYLQETFAILDSSCDFEDKVKTMLIHQRQFIDQLGVFTVSIFSSKNTNFDGAKNVLTENPEWEIRWRLFLLKEQESGNINPYLPVDAILLIDKKLNECFYMPEFIDLFPNKQDRMDVMIQYWMNGVRKDGER